MKHKFFLDAERLCWWCNKERVEVISITFVSKGGWCVFFKEKRPTEDAKKLDPDKVIAWLVANICDFEYYVKLFKKDFKLCKQMN